jgi:hypothetical protein
MLSCKYVIEQNLAGDFVECGVWRGGNSILAAGMFKLYNQNRKVYLFDTFCGMTEPKEVDFEISSGKLAHESLNETSNKNNSYIWAYATLEDVKTNFYNYNLLDDNIIFIKGDILKTLENFNMPAKIAILRLDTDWYESTRVEMEILYPMLVAKGILILDDYGFWRGSRAAVDEYMDNNKLSLFLNRIDYSGRLIVKPN